MSLLLLQITKEDRPGPEVAKEITDKVAPELEKVKDYIEKILKSWLEEEYLQNREVVACQILLFSSYMPYVFELLSNVLRDTCPNLKKKKAPEFDALKTNVIKVMKALVGMFKNHFEALSIYYKDQSAISFIN